MKWTFLILATLAGSANAGDALDILEVRMDLKVIKTDVCNKVRPVITKIKKGSDPGKFYSYNYNGSIKKAKIMINDVIKSDNFLDMLDWKDTYMHLGHNNLTKFVMDEGRQEFLQIFLSPTAQGTTNICFNSVLMGLPRP